MSKQSGASESAKLNDYQKSILDVVCKKPGQTCKQDTYYLNRLNDIHEGNRVFSFNWAAAIFGPIWFVYRKMYLCAFTFIFGSALLSGIGFNSVILSIFGYECMEALGENHYGNLISIIIYGYIGNICYYGFISKKSKQLVCDNYSATHTPLFMVLYLVVVLLLIVLLVAASYCIHK
jgi:membrane associated rhomboid family serine protease